MGNRLSRKPNPIQWVRDGTCMICTSHNQRVSLYPEMKRNGKRMKIARHILFHKYGVQPTAIVARHTCDNRFCINPDHIIPGTNHDNSRDMVERGRSSYGERNPASKLNQNQVREIRELCRQGHLPSKLAPRFGVSASLIKMIRRNEIWKHVV